MKLCEASRRDWFFVRNAKKRFLATTRTVPAAQSCSFHQVAKQSFFIIIVYPFGEEGFIKFGNNNMI